MSDPKTAALCDGEVKRKIIEAIDVALKIPSCGFHYEDEFLIAVKLIPTGVKVEVVRS